MSTGQVNFWSLGMGFRDIIATAVSNVYRRLPFGYCNELIVIMAGVNQTLEKTAE